MRSRPATLTAAITVSLVLRCGLVGAAAAQNPPPQHLIPQSLQLEHRDTLERLTTLTHRRGPVGVAARDALALLKTHMARESEYILPPLALLPDLAAGKVTPDMKWALPMCDQVKAEREQLLQEHDRITDLMNALLAAARRTRDKEAQDFAEAAVGDSLNDQELLLPMTLLVGDILRAKLPAGQ